MSTAQTLACIDDYHGDCSGDVELRESLTGTGTPIPRCDKHWNDRLDREEGYRAFESWGRNVDWFDAGEVW